MFNTMSHSTLMKLFNDATDPYSNEISRFKAKYGEMVKEGKLKRANMVSPCPDDNKDIDGNATNKFVRDYVDDLTPEQRDSVIATYGCGNAIALFCDWQRSTITDVPLNDEDADGLFKGYLQLVIKNPVDTDLIRDTTYIILRHSINLDSVNYM